MKQSSTSKAIDILLTITTFEQAQRMLLRIVRDRPSCIVNAAEPSAETLHWPTGETEALQGPTLEERHEACIVRYLQNHRFVATIKWFRLVTGQGLKEAKDTIDSIRDRYRVESGDLNSSYTHYNISDETKLLIQLIWQYGQDAAILHLTHTNNVTEETASLLVARTVAAYDLQY